MTFPTHLLAGLVIGKLTGNYPLSIAVAVGVDVDHFFSYAKNGTLSSVRKFIKASLAKDDPYGDQKNILHNVFIFALISFVVYIFNHKIGLIFSLAYLSNLMLDALDNSDYFPFFPNKKINIRGPIEYASWKELLIVLFLIATFLLV